MQKHPFVMPMDKNIFILSNFLKAEQDNVEVYVVGGAVRDFLLHKFHGDSTEEFKPKDYDITTNLSEEEILERLQTPLAKKHGIKVKEKTSIDTFGVVFVNFRGKNYEVSPFRVDVGGDGRRPEKTQRGTLLEDAMRRDFTINNLYYDFEKEVILDLNPNNSGIRDIQRKMIRCVGAPRQRFSEDKLRILRMVRFFSRFDEGYITHNLDSEHIDAVLKFIELEGISSERIQAEFCLGIEQSKYTEGYLKSLKNLGLTPRMFPSLEIDFEGFRKIRNHKGICSILAWMFRKNKDMDKHLNCLKYPKEISETVQFLINLFNSYDDDIFELVRFRNRHPKEGNYVEDIMFLANCNGEYSKYLRLKHFSQYIPPVIDSYELMRNGFEGPQIGQEQKRITNEHYGLDYEKFIRNHFETVLF